MTKVTIDRAALRRLSNEKARECAERGARVAMTRAKANLTAKNRVNTGALRSSIRVLDVKVSEGRVTITLGSDLPYALWQEEGVRGPVRPTSAKVLRFIPKGGSGYVFARETRGFPGAHYMRDALKSLTVRDFLP